MKLHKSKIVALLGAITLVPGCIFSQARAVEQSVEFSMNSPLSVTEFEADIEAKASELTYIDIQVQDPTTGQTLTFGSLGAHLTVDAVVEAALVTLEDMRLSEISKPDAGGKDNGEKWTLLAHELKDKSFIVSHARGTTTTQLANTSIQATIPRESPSDKSSAVTSTTALTATSTCGIWRPNFHENIAAPSAFQGQRYDQLKFAFTQGQLDEFACTGSTGFEPDLVTDNYDNLHYFSNPVVSFSSNMPFNYLDTNFSDGPNEIVYTIGTYKISALSPWTEYTNYIRTGFGNTGADRAKVVWQRNSMLSACFPIFGPEWCSFADESVIQYAWKIPLPGTYPTPSP